MREIILDTETTGFKPEEGERVIEIGAIEFVNRIATGNVFHEYINPEDHRVDPGALAVHGLSNEFLADKKIFSDIAGGLVAFLGDANLVAHNAPFDMNFLNHEFARAGLPAIDPARVIDTLEIARRKFPNAQNSLDRLCERFGIDNSHRAKHGALLDCELLSEVYIELLGGRQTSLDLATESQEDAESANRAGTTTARPKRRKPLPVRLSDDETTAHEAFIKSLGADAIWNRYSS